MNENKEAEEQLLKDKKILNSELSANSFYMAADAISTLHGRGKNLDLLTLTKELITSSKKINKGQTQEIEYILMNHIKTLDFLFYDALTKLAHEDTNMINKIDAITNIAFRSQAQCRKTIAVLAELKNPKRSAMFIKQQNNAINQQVNNGIESNPEKKEILSEFCNKLEVKNEQCMDTRTKTEGIRDDPSMATLEESRS